MVLLYSCLMIVFVSFYLQDQMSDFIMKRTTMSTRFETPKQIEFPTITICMQEGMKQSVKEKYGLDQNQHILHNYFGKTDNPYYVGYPNMSLSEIFYELSYILGRDFTMKLSHSLAAQQYLKVGLNSINFMNGTLDMYIIKSINTYYYGTCYKIQPMQSDVWFKSRAFSITIQLLTKNISTKDIPKGFQLYFTSNDTWHGVITDTWRRFNPSMIDIEFGGNQLRLSLKTISKQFKKGTLNSTLCFNQLFSNHFLSCTPMCDLLSYNTIPACTTAKDQTCISDQEWKVRQNCLDHKNIVNFDPIIRQGRSVPKDTASLEINFGSWDREAMEEIDVISLSSLIGSVGGSLGMFFGFSISGYLLSLIRRCLTRLSSFQSNRPFIGNQ